MDFYAILGVTREASHMEVKRAYRRLARRFHPDINPGDDVAAVRFKEIAQAYETLSDPERRRHYDLLGYVAVSSNEAAAVGFEGFDFSAAVHANVQSTFGDLFAEVLRGSRPPRATPQRGADIHATLTLAFDEALIGGERPLTVTRLDRCAACAGRGTQSGAAARCVQCQGSGSLRSARGHMVFARSCPRCGGTGVERQQPCPQCAASGVHRQTEVTAVRWPAGIADGVRLRVADKGHAGTYGGSTGDLYVTVRVQPHERLHREGDDLHMVLPLGIHEAALGTRLDVPGLDGPLRVRVPPGTQSGQRFRLRGRGAPSPQDGRRGDLIVEVRLMLPRVLDERSKELLREFGRINGESVRDF
jgi:molecular chaperone DnaJ